MCTRTRDEIIPKIKAKIHIIDRYSCLETSILRNNFSVKKFHPKNLIVQKQLKKKGETYSSIVRFYLNLRGCLENPRLVQRFTS